MIVTILVIIVIVKARIIVIVKILVIIVVVLTVQQPRHPAASGRIWSRPNKGRVCELRKRIIHATCCLC